MGCPFSWKDYVGIWFATLVGCHIDIIKPQATERKEPDMLHMLEKGGYPEGHRMSRGSDGRAYTRARAPFGVPSSL